MKLLNFFKLLFRRTKGTPKDYYFRLYHERISVTDTVYSFKANSKSEAKKIFKMFLFSLNGNAHFAHPISVQPSVGVLEKTFCLGNNFMSETAADHLAHQVYNRKIDSAAQEQQTFYTRLKDRLVRSVKPA